VSQTFYKEVLALAGIIQAAELVALLANTGTAPAENFNTSLASILKINPGTIEEIYDGRVNSIPGLKLGFSALNEMLEQKKQPNNSRLRYAVGLMHLQRKLQANTTLMAQLGNRIEQMEHKLEHFELTHERNLAGLSSIYEDTLSTFRFRIQVTGNAIHLQNPLVVHKIRSALLAGIRSAMLWQQVGGKRWHLVLYRKKLLAALTTII
jgi:high frequency lysogenization protein